MTTIEAATRADGKSTTGEGPWFVHPAVDVAFLGGLSIVVFAVFNNNHRLATNANVASVAATLAWVVNWPHFSATNYRLYGSKANRSQFPITAYVVPALLLLATIASFRSPDVIAPALVKLYLLWSPYHFSGQTLGIALLYARRAGFEIRAHERNALFVFILATFALPSSRADIGLRESSFYGVRYPGLDLPTWFPDVITVLLWAALAVFVVSVAWRTLSAGPRRRLPPIMLLLTPAAQFVWFIATPAGNYFTYLVPLFHSLQYLFIAWLVQLRERLNNSGDTPSRRFVWRTTSGWAIVNFFGGALLFWVLPRVGTRFGVSLAYSTAIVLSAVQIHHFFVDGVIWKLRSPISPLSTTMAELTGRSAPQQADS